MFRYRNSIYVVYVLFGGFDLNSRTKIYQTDKASRRVYNIAMINKPTHFWLENLKHHGAKINPGRVSFLVTIHMSSIHCSTVVLWKLSETNKNRTQTYSQCPRDHVNALSCSSYKPIYVTAVCDLSTLQTLGYLWSTVLHALQAARSTAMPPTAAVRLPFPLLPSQVLRKGLVS